MPAIVMEQGRPGEKAPLLETQKAYEAPPITRGIARRWQSGIVAIRLMLGWLVLSALLMFLVLMPSPLHGGTSKQNAYTDHWSWHEVAVPEQIGFSTY